MMKSWTEEQLRYHADMILSYGTNRLMFCLLSMRAARYTHAKQDARMGFHLIFEQLASTFVS